MDVVGRYLARVGELVGLPVPNVTQSKGLYGPACLRSVLLYYGIDKSEAELARLCESDPEDGTLPENIVRAAETLGFRAFQQNDASLAEVSLWVSRGVPVIVHWFSTDLGHYSVVNAIRGDRIYLMDPEHGVEREMPLSVFQRVWFHFEQPPVEAHQGLRHHQIVVVLPPQ